MKRTTVMLHTEEHEALLLLAERERRDPRSQAAVLIRRELERRGLLSANHKVPKQRAEPPEPRHA